MRTARPLVCVWEGGGISRGIAWLVHSLSEVIPFPPSLCIYGYLTAYCASQLGRSARRSRSSSLNGQVQRALATAGRRLVSSVCLACLPALIYTQAGARLFSVRLYIRYTALYLSHCCISDPKLS